MIQTLVAILTLLAVAAVVAVGWRLGSNAGARLKT